MGYHKTRVMESGFRMVELKDWQVWKYRLEKSERDRLSEVSEIDLEERSVMLAKALSEKLDQRNNKKSAP
jgi:hypothetical protein